MKGVLSVAILLLMVYHSIVRNTAENNLGKEVGAVILSAANNTD